MLGFCFVFAALAARAETLKFTDGGTLTGEIVKPDNSGLMFHAEGDVYTNIAWARLSQDTLKEISSDPKVKDFADPFIEPSGTVNAAAPIQLNPVTRIERPAHPSLILGMVTSPLGLFILLVLYGANLFAAFEISRVKARTPAQVMGVSAILPVIGPCIFLYLPMHEEKTPEQLAEEQPFPEGEQTPEQIQVVEHARAEAGQQEKKLEPQIFARGKFTFNKRFVETKFANYMGVPKGEALKYAMEMKTSQGVFVVDQIMQVSATDVLLDVAGRGQLTVQLSDIQEVKLNPKKA
jgi:hypothetical protein